MSALDQPQLNPRVVRVKGEPPKQDDSAKPYLSPSQINSYTRCGEAYRRRYIEKEIIPPAFAMLKGSAVHIGAETNFKQKIETRKDLTRKEIVEVAVASFDGKLKLDGVLLSAEEESVGQKIVEGAARDSTARMADKFATDVAPIRQPIAVEEKVRLTLPGPRDLLGIMDAVLDDGVQDLKTSGKKKTQADVDADVLFTTYASLYFKKYGKPPKTILIDNIVDRGPGKTEFQPLTTERGPIDFQALARRINTVTSGIEAGMFMPATPGAWWCSAKSCGYHRTCPYVNSTRRAAGDANDK